ncbi:IS3 family transposase, partial [Sharpea azabuensis]|uniref:IS3 family transposase n=1 Tax=Sharpea azabuensis TaxID=322505 RepID=UPI003CFE54E4
EWTSKMQGYFPIAVENNGLFGYQKMTYALNNNSDVKYNRKRIYRIMAVNGIESHFRIGRRHSNYRKQRITYWIGISMPKHRI